MCLVCKLFWCKSIIVHITFTSNVIHIKMLCTDSVVVDAVAGYCLHCKYKKILEAKLAKVSEANFFKYMHTILVNR